MAKKIDEEEIRLINEAYLQFGTYAAAARAVGCAPSTAKKYIIDDYKIQPTTREHKEIVFKSVSDTVEQLKNIKSASLLTPREKAELKEIWKGMNF